MMYFNYNKTKKKAQVTLFVIIAMIILLGIILSYSFIKSLNTNFNSEEFNFIQNSFQQCYENNLKSNIKTLARNGGYLYLDKDEFEKYLENNDVKGYFFKNNFYPYYNYLDNNVLKTSLPTISFIEEELSFFTNKKTENCIINNIEKYNSNTTNKIFYNNIKVDSKVVISEDKIKYSSTLKGTFKKNSATKSSFKISDSFNSDFKKMYDIVKGFSSYEYFTGFLEYYILDIISLNDGVGKKYPPFYALDFSYNINFWNSNTVSSELKNDIKKQFSIFRFSSKDDLENYNTLPLMLKRAFITLKNKDDYFGDYAFLHFVDVPDVDVKFNKQLFVSGEKINMPVDILSSLIPIRVYYTKYDIKAPILFSVRSKNSDLLFNFAFETNIKHNSPVKEKVSPYIEDFNVNDDAVFLEKVRESDFYCRKPLGNKVSFEFYDEDNNKLDNVNILFFCGDESCAYSYNSNNNKVTLPLCYNAKISFKHNDLDFDNINDYKSLDNSFEDSFSLVGYKKHKLSLKVNIYDLLKVTEREAEEKSSKLFKDKNRLISLKPDHYELSSNKRFFENGENLILTFKKLNSDFFYSIKINNSNYNDYKEIYLYPGDYSLNILLLKKLDEPFYIPEREDCVFGYPNFVCIGRQKYDKVEFNNTFLEFSFNYNESLPFNIPFDKVKNDNAVLEFNIPAFVLFKVPENERFIDDLSFMDYGSEIFLTNNNLGVFLR